jgi:predicted anti-sigma-YlaC factor YlaD
MKCRNIKKNLIYYIDNELSVDRAINVTNHLENCTNCRNYLAFLQSELHIINEEKNQEVTPFFYTRLENEEEYRIQRSWISLLQPALFSLVLMIGIYGGFQIGNDASSPIIDQNAQSAMQLLDEFESEPIESFLLDIL